MNTCRLFPVVPGFASSDRASDLFDSAVTLAWEHRSKLGKRDLALLEALRGANYPRESSSRETLAALNRALIAAPDRPETHYLLGTLLLYQGPALGLSDSRARAAAQYREASMLDSSYLGPLARMVEISALDRNVAGLRRDVAAYLARDATGPTADYVRWIGTAGTASAAEQQRMRANLRTFRQETLERIYILSQMSGLGLEDADSVAKILVDKATDPIEKSVAFRRAQILALNRGRPLAATAFLHETEDLRSPGYTFPQFAVAAGMFSDGDKRVADSSSRVLSRNFDHDTITTLAPNQVRMVSSAMAIQSLWYVSIGDTASAYRAARWVGRHSAGQSRNGVLSILPEMLVSSVARRPEGGALRAKVDSIMLDGCCQMPDFVNIVLAQAYEDAGDNASALRVIKRGFWYQPPRQVSTYFRSEGRLSAKMGDRPGAIMAYDRFLSLRSSPEASLKPGRDSIVAELDRLKRAH